MTRRGPGGTQRAQILAALLLVVCVGRAHAQGRFTNARTETHAAPQGPDAIAREVRAVAARGGAAWIGYRVAMVAGPRHMCCYDSFNDANACCGMCRLENGSGVTMTTGDLQSRGSRIVLEPPTEFLVLARVENGAVMRLRTFTPDCDVDAGNMPVVWLTDVRADDSVAWLSDLVKTSGTAGSDREKTNRVADPALAALSMHTAPAALTALIRFAKEAESTRLRGQALFWLAQRAGEQAAATITNAITDDPDTEVKKKAVFALSQMPKDEGIPKLIEVARTNRNPEVRKQAYFWLGQTHDPRAVAFFEEILKR